MTLTESKKGFTFTGPGNYRIRVQGFLDENWSERLGGMYLTINHREDRGTLATLVGRLQDQAELAGVLNTLYEMHLPLLLVEYLDGD
jgi:hypothetical protein